MPRYIDADETLRQLENNRKDNPCQPPYRGIWDRASKNAIDTIEAIPTADVVERRRGEWKIFGDVEKFFMCTACNSKLKLFAKFCPECGADMRGDNNGKA